jgi:hypothetical protein
MTMLDLKMGLFGDLNLIQAALTPGVKSRVMEETFAKAIWEL